MRVQGDIVAFTNLYSGCGGQVPGDYWSYNTGGQVLTSPVISLDGTQVAFTQTNGTVAGLVLLRWNPRSTVQPFRPRSRLPATESRLLMPPVRRFRV